VQKSLFDKQRGFPGLLRVIRGLLRPSVRSHGAIFANPLGALREPVGASGGPWMVCDVVSLVHLPYGDAIASLRSPLNLPVVLETYGDLHSLI
jgi:hypothetical protein